MSFTAKIIETWQEGTETPVTNQITVEADSRQSFDIAVPGETTDQLVSLTIDVSEVEAIMFLADQDLTIETNSGSAADDTLALKANAAYIWHPDKIDAFQLGTDVTALYVSNAGATAATLKIRALIDATPA